MLTCSLFEVADLLAYVLQFCFGVCTLTLCCL